MITPRPRAILFDLFHTLVSVPPPGGDMGLSIAEALGMPEHHAEVARRYYEDDVLDRCRGRVRDPYEMMRAVAHGLNPGVSDSAIVLAVEHRRRRVAHGLLGVEPAFLSALDRVRAAGIATALVSDAGFDDIEAWHQSPLASRLDVTIFSCEVGSASRIRGSIIVRSSRSGSTLATRSSWVTEGATSIVAHAPGEGSR